MKLTLKILESFNACHDGKMWFAAQKSRTVKGVVDKLIAQSKLDWANWTVSRMMNHDNKIRYAIFAAEQVLSIYEKQHPDDAHPRKAIEAAKKYLADKSEKNKNAANAAANAAYAAAYAANTAAYAAYAAAYAANTAAYAANTAANAAYAAANAAAYAANTAAYAAMKEKIIRFGLTLIKDQK